MTNIKTPVICSVVQALGNMAKLKNIVAALRVVVVTDMVRAPNRFVIAHAQLPPNMPNVEKKNSVKTLSCIDHDDSTFVSNSSIVPGVRKKN
mmetsp:Transcript_16853/g.21321  ORF Transcript_16853/g.21321 Transcript_16853/m.21321 type:complete len:92 (-) Transcript_16853:1204-1479(-)